MSLVEKRRNSYVVKSVIGEVEIENLIVTRPITAKRVKGCFNPFYPSIY